MVEVKATEDELFSRSKQQILRIREHFEGGGSARGPTWAMILLLHEATCDFPQRAHRKPVCKALQEGQHSLAPTSAAKLVAEAPAELMKPSEEFRHRVSLRASGAIRLWMQLRLGQLPRLKDQS